MKEAIRQHLESVILPFWTALYDVEHGGFYGHVDNDHTVHPEANKGLVQQARHLYAFSRLYRTYQDPSLLPLIDGTYRFLRNHFYVTSAKRYGWLVKHDGTMIDSRIVTYGQAFVIYGLSEYAMARHSDEALEEALRLYRAVESRHVDPLTGGYIEEFDADMKPRAARQLADGIEGVSFTANTHLHLLEAVHHLVKASGDASTKRTLHHLIHLLRDKHYNQDCKSLAMYCDDSFRCIHAPRSYGHDIEASWLIAEAAKELRLPEEYYLPMCESLAQGVLQHGFDGHYVHYELRNGIDDPTMVWWVQCEAMVGFLCAYRMSGKNEYLHATKQVYESIQTHLVDKRKGGEWYWSVDKDGHPEPNRGMAELWKTTYHNVRALIETIERL